MRRWADQEQISSRRCWVCWSRCVQTTCNTAKEWSSRKKQNPAKSIKILHRTSVTLFFSDVHVSFVSWDALGSVIYVSWLVFWLIVMSEAIFYFVELEWVITKIISCKNCASVCIDNVWAQVCVFQQNFAFPMRFFW